MTKGSQVGVVLTPEERLARRRLILRDTISLLILFLTTAVVFVLTWLLYRSFTDHEKLLGERWKARGVAALDHGDPQAAVDSLRSALAYVPSRETEIDLATALAEAGKTQEAFAYFNTLLLSEPGDGMINLQLARLAAKQGNESLAVLRYQSALDGTWQGNGFERRRDVRLEMAGYLISRQRYSQARAQLLIAESNLPEEAPALRTRIAGMLEQAQDLTDALDLYRAVAARRSAPVAALQGAGGVAFDLGMYRVAAQYLGRELADPKSATLPPSVRAADEKSLQTSQQVLLLFPAPDLSARARAERILADKKIARTRLTSCSASATAASPQLAPVITQWDQLPAHLTLTRLEQNQDLETTVVQLVYDTETVTAKVCGAPSGDDAVLLRIAKNPGAVEEE